MPRHHDAFEKWFFEQRVYPGNSLPKDALGQAHRHAALRNSDADEPDSSVTHWVAIGPSTIPNGQTDQTAGGPAAAVSGRVTAIAIDFFPGSIPGPS